MSRELLGHTARKRFGQNFLADTQVIERIVRAIAPQADDAMVEIGPGLGALTHALLTHLRELFAVELDRDLAARLRVETLIGNKLRLFEANALKFDFRQLAPGRALRVVGNLPYNISTPLIFPLLEQADIIADMHFMLQKEVVERMAAAPGDAAYGRLSVMVQVHCQVESLFTVPPSAFTPAPKVESAIVRLQPYPERPWPAFDHRHLQALVTQAFGQRRKTLRNALRESIDARGLEDLGIDPGARPETLSVADYVRLAGSTETI